MGGDIYRVGARQGATPPSTPVHEVDSGQGSSGPETDIHIYVQSRPLSLPPPRAPSRARLPAPSEPHHPPSSILHPPRQPQGPGGALGASGAHARRRLAPSPRPFSLIPSSPRRLPSVHLLLPTGECSGPTETGAPSPPSPFPYARGGRPGPRSPSEPTPTTRSPWLTALPAGRSACHAMLDGRLGGPGPCSVARCQATVRLPLRCATKRLDASPPRPRAVAPVMPCHAMPSHPPHRPSRTTPMQTHRPSLASNRARKRSAVPTRFSGAHKCTHSGPPPASQPKSSAPLPCCQLARTGAAPPRGPGSTTPHPNWRLGTGLGHPVPGTTTPPAKSSAPLQCCQLAKGRAH